MPITLSTFCTVLTKMTLSTYPNSKNDIIKVSSLQNIIISDVLASYDMAHQTKTAREIERDMNDQYYFNEVVLGKYDYLRNLVIEICKNHGVKRYIAEGAVNKRAILYNSILDAERRFEETANKGDYKKLFYTLDKRNKKILLSEKHELIIHYLKEKLKKDSDVEKITSLLTKTKNNFLLQDEYGNDYYPVISDLLFDTFNLDYYFGDATGFIKSLCDSIDATRVHQKSSTLKLPRRLYAKAVFIEKVKKNNARTYILKEYARTLQWEEEDFRELYLEILYYNANDGKNTLLSELDILKIFPRCFLLNKTKIIILVGNPEVTLSTMHEFAIYKKLEQQGKI